MVITLENPHSGVSNRFKVNENLVKLPTPTPFSTVVAAPQLMPQSMPQPMSMPQAQAKVVPSVPSQPVKQEMAKSDKPDFKNEPPIQKALRQLEESYTNMKESINLKRFDAQKIEEYLMKAEKRTGLPYSDEEKGQFRQLAQSTDVEHLKLLCLELHVGISEKAEKEAMAAMGRLILHRNQTQALRAYMELPGKDPNLKAYIRTVLMMHKVENWMNTVEDVKRKVKRTVSPFKWLVPAVKHQQNTP